MRIACIGVLVAEIDRKFEAYDRLDAVACHLVGEFQRPEHVVGVGQRERRLAVGLGELTELGDLDRALQERIGGMDVEVDESGGGHGTLLGSRLFGGSDHAAGFSRRLATRWWRLHPPESTRNPPDRAPFPLIPKDASPKTPRPSELGEQLRPDCDHPDEQRQRREGCSLFHENLQHARLRELDWTRTYPEHCSIFVPAVKAKKCSTIDSVNRSLPR